jgi:hypothetical protein
MTTPPFDLVDIDLTEVGIERLGREAEREAVGVGMDVVDDELLVIEAMEAVAELPPEIWLG